MKILVREYNGNICNYVWKTVSQDMSISVRGYHTIDNKYYNSISVIKITSDYRSNGKYVVCGHCKRTIRKSAIESHYRHQEEGADCSKCDNLTLTKIKETQKNKLMPDFTMAVTYKAIAECKIDYYRTQNLSEIDKPRYCKYYKCRRSNTEELEKDFFSEYPNPYKTLISENCVIKNGWKLFNSTDTSREYCIKDGKLIATFDTNGILKFFGLLNRDNRYNFVYSDVYDKFFGDGMTTREFNFADIAIARANKYKKAIRKLYK